MPSVSGYHYQDLALYRSSATSLMHVEAIGAPLFPWRYDLFPTMLTAAALLAVISGRPAVAGAMVGLGVCAKLYPLVLVPIFGAYYISTNDFRSVARLVGSAAVVAAGPVIPFLVLAPHELLSFVRYHELRGLEIESAGAGVLSLIYLVGGPAISAEQNFGAVHIKSPLGPPFSRRPLSHFDRDSHHTRVEQVPR